MGRPKKDPSQLRARVGLTRCQEHHLRKRLRKKTPSEPWIDAQITSIIDTDPEGKPIHCRFHDPKVFPPGGASTLMVRCSICGIFNPPNAMEDGQCLDHAEDAGWGSSPSARAIRTLQRYHVIEEHALPLEPEDEESLKREIALWLLEHPETGSFPRSRPSDAVSSS